MYSLDVIKIILPKETKVNDILDKYIAAWNEHDLKKIDTYYVIWYDLGYDYTTKGKKSVSKAITDVFMRYVPDMYWVKNGDVFTSDNTTIYEWVYGGAFDGEWDFIPVKNKKFEIKGLSITTINRYGEIISHKDYYNLLDLKKQLVLIK